MKVSHPSYGVGDVLNTRYGGFQFLVKFQDGRQLWVFRNRVKRLDSKQIEEVPHKQTNNSKNKFPDNLSEIEIIDAFRLGVVPIRDLESITYGRTVEISEIDNWVKNKKQGTAIIIGDYGAGKSHLLEYTKQLYLEKGYAVSDFMLSLNGASFNKPKEIYANIVDHLVYRKNAESYGFRDLLRQYVSLVNENQSNSIQNYYFDYFVKRFGEDNIDDEDYLWKWIEGKSSNSYRFPLKMYNSFTAGNLYSNLISAIGKIVKLIGLNGLIVIIDEFEFVFDGTLITKSQFIQSLLFLKGITLMTSQNEILLSEKITMGAYFSGKFVGINTNLFYEKNQQVRYMEAGDFNVKLLLSAVGNDSVNEISERLDIRRIELRTLSKVDVDYILKKALEVYTKAYPNFELGNSNSAQIREIVEKKFFSNGVRNTLKAYVEALDLFRYNKITQLDELE